MNKDLKGLQQKIQKLKCCECGRALNIEAVGIENPERFYCVGCKLINNVKNNWRPLGSGRVDKVFTIARQDKPNTFKAE